MIQTNIANRTKIEDLLFEQKGITTHQIAEVTEIPYSTVSKWRNGNRNYTIINLDYAIRLTVAYDKLVG